MIKIFTSLNRTCLFILLASTVAAGQADTNKSIIFYDDGSVFIGEVLLSDHKHMRMRISTLDTITIQPNSIKRIFSAQDVIVYNNGKYHNISGLFSFGNLSIPIGSSSFQMDGAIGYRLNQKYAAGLGMGIGYHEAYLGGLFIWHDFYSIFAYGRYFINNKKIRLFTDAKLGYGLPLEEVFADSHSGGLMFEPGLGIIFPSRNRFRWFISLNNHIQSTRGEHNTFDSFNNPINTSYAIVYNRFFLKVGLEFN